MDYEQGYNMLRDAIIEHLKPQDGDEAEIDILLAAIERAGAVLSDQLAWAEDEQDMQQIQHEWSQYDRDPAGS